MSDTDYDMAPAVDLANSWARECGLPEIESAAGLLALIGSLWDRQGNVSAAYHRAEYQRLYASMSQPSPALAQLVAACEAVVQAYGHTTIRSRLVDSDIPYRMAEMRAALAAFDAEKGAV